MKTISTIFILCCLVSCSWEEYPPEKYIITQVYRELIVPYHQGDTLKFKNDKGELSTVLIEKVDSVLHNKRGHFINSAEYKSISVECRELTGARRGYEQYTLVAVNKDPKNDETGFSFRFRIFIRYIQLIHWCSKQIRWTLTE